MCPPPSGVTGVLRHPNRDPLRGRLDIPFESGPRQSLPKEELVHSSLCQCHPTVERHHRVNKGIHMPRVQLRNWSPGQVHRQHRPGETRQVMRLNSPVTGIHEPVHRRLQRLPSVDRDTELAGREVHVETQLSPQLRREVSLLFFTKESYGNGKT